MKIGEEKNHLLGLAQDLHPLDNAHAERTTIKHLRISAKVLYYYSNPDFITFLRHYMARIENQ